jgi:hypothetical protein
MVEPGDYLLQLEEKLNQAINPNNSQFSEHTMAYHVLTKQLSDLELNRENFTIERKEELIGKLEEILGFFCGPEIAQKAMVEIKRWSKSYSMP